MVAWWGSDLDPRSLNRSQCARVCVRCHWRVDFFSNHLSPPAVQGTLRGWRGLADPSKLAELGTWGEGHGDLDAPLHCSPLGGKTRKKGASKSFLPGSARSALPLPYQGQPRLLRYRAQRLQPAREPSPGQRSGLRARPPPSARPPRNRRWDRWGRQRRARLGADGRQLARA